MRALYIRLTDSEYEGLVKMSTEARRGPQEQAAYLVGRGIHAWCLQKDFEASLPPLADDDPIEAVA